jgi:hypothetical protein
VKLPLTISEMRTITTVDTGRGQILQPDPHAVWGSLFHL